MYDHEGGDTGFEWVELYNSGVESVDIGTWHFFEGETHHGLTPDGFSMLDSGDRALIVQNLENIYGEYGNNVKLIKSSFSLNNTGESLSISDAENVLQTTIEYSVDDGGAGNGYSLQRVDSHWFEGTPTPGMENIQGEDNDSIVENDNATVDSHSSKSVDSDYYTGTFHISNNILAGSPVDIAAYVIHTHDGRSVKILKGGVYYINFGDGSYIESLERINTQHIYEYPGTYEVIFEFYKSLLERELSDEDPQLVIRKTITVYEHNVGVTDIDNQSGIVITNTSGVEVDLAGWSLAYGDSVYTFPRYSILSKGNSIVISRQTHNLGTIQDNDWIRLRNQTGYTVSSFQNNDTNINNKTVLNSEDGEVVENISDSNVQAGLDRFLAEHPEKEEVVFNSFYDEQESNNNPSSIPMTTTLITGGVALALAGVRFVHGQRKQKTSEETSSVVGDIELIE